MKKLALFIFLVLFPTVYYAQNLLNNADFEMGTAYGNEWTGTNFGIERTNVIEGSYSLELGTTYGLATIYQSCPVTAGNYYSLSCSAKAQTGQQGSFILQYNKGAGWVNFKYKNISSTTANNYEITFVAEASTSYRVYFSCEVGNKIWLDNVIFSQTFLFSTGKDIISTSIGTLDATNKIISNIPKGLITVGELKKGLVISDYATAFVFTSTNRVVTDNDLVDATMNIQVFSETGDGQKYTLQTTNKALRYTRMGQLNKDNNSISGIVPSLTVSEFIRALIVYDGATVTILDGTTAVANPTTTLISSSMTLKITGTDGTTTYTLNVTPAVSALPMHIISVPFGYVNESAWEVSVPSGTYVWQLKGLLKVTTGYSFDILFGGDTAPLESEISAGMIVKVGSREYTITIDETSVAPTSIEGKKLTQTTLGFPMILNGKTQVHFTSTAPIAGGTINFNSEDAWVFFDNIKPSVVAAYYLAFMAVKDQAAVLDQNVRVVQYSTGTVVIPHTPTYKALSVYSEKDLQGASSNLAVAIYTGVAGLGTMHENIKSFQLKRGYMATMAQESDGTGYSKVYIANDSDLVVNLPAKLNSVSFIRVLKWRWPHKKGLADGSTVMCDTLGGSWWYDWQAYQTSTLDREYVPLQTKIGWPSYSDIGARTDSPNALSLNEPDNASDDGGYSSPKAVADTWKGFLGTGLRLGTPAVTDGGLDTTGTGWLYKFIDTCDARGYRVDFIAIHWYRQNDAASLYNYIKAIHNRTGRPIWVTEFGYGADWTAESSSATNATNAAMIQSYINMLDTVSYVERYAIFNLGNTKYHRAVWSSTSPVTLTATGDVYKAKTSTTSYQPSFDYYTNYKSIAYTNMLNNTTLPTASWTLQYVDSQEMSTGNEAPATNTFDRDITTIWHTQWNAAQPVNPHEIQICLGDTFLLKDFIYIPRQDMYNGMIADFEFYTSLDGINWGEPIIFGKWSKDISTKMMSCGNTQAQYIRLVSKSEVNGNAFASAAEIALTGKVYTPESPIITTNIAEETKSNINFSIFPNPTSTQQFYILSPNLTNEVVDISVIGVDGNIIYQGKKNIANNVIEINLNQNVASGIYFVRITSKNTTYTKKLIVK